MASWTPILKHCDFLLSWNGTTFWRVELHHWTCLRDCPREEQCLKQANLSCTFGGGIITTTTTTTEVRDRQAFSWNRDAFMNQLKTQVIQLKGQNIFSLWWVAFVQFFYLNGWIFQGFVAVIGWTTKYQNQIAITIFPITSTIHIIMIIILLLTLLWLCCWTLLLFWLMTGCEPLGSAGSGWLRDWTLAGFSLNNTLNSLWPGKE